MRTIPYLLARTALWLSVAAVFVMLTFVFDGPLRVLSVAGLVAFVLLLAMAGLTVRAANRHRTAGSTPVPPVALFAWSVVATAAGVVAHVTLVVSLVAVFFVGAGMLWFVPVLGMVAYKVLQELPTLRENIAGALNAYRVRRRARR